MARIGSGRRTPLRWEPTSRRILVSTESRDSGDPGCLCRASPAAARLRGGGPRGRLHNLPIYIAAFLGAATSTGSGLGARSRQSRPMAEDGPGLRNVRAALGRPSQGVLVATGTSVAPPLRGFTLGWRPAGERRRRRGAAVPAPEGFTPLQAQHLQHGVRLRRQAPQGRLDVRDAKQA